MTIYLITRKHRSGLSWDEGGVSTLEFAQHLCRGNPEESTAWRLVEPPLPGRGPLWTTQIPEAYEWFEIEATEPA